MFTYFKKFSVIATVIFFLAACNNGENDNDTADSVNTETTSPTEKAEAQNDKLPDSAESDADYLVDAAKGSLKEVECSKMAAKKSTSKEVKAFANMMITDHTTMNKQVKTLAASKNISLPIALDKDVMDKITNNDKTGVDFDKDYADKMVDDHERTVNLFEKASNRANDPDIKKLFADALPKLRHHLEQAKALQDKLRNTN